MTRPRVGDEPVRQRGEIRRLPAEQAASEPDRVDDRRRDPVARSGASSRCRGTPCRSARCARRGRRRRRRRESAASPPRRAARGAALRRAGRSAPRRPAAAARRGSRASGTAPRARARARAPRRSRTAALCPDEPGRLEVEDDEGRVLEQRASSPGAAASATRSPAQRSRASSCTASSSSERASPTGTALPSFRTCRAASSTGTGPRRSSTSSTSRSAHRDEVAPNEPSTNMCSCLVERYEARRRASRHLPLCAASGRRPCRGAGRAPSRSSTSSSAP